MNKNCCKDCPNRTVEPNCHMTCEKYAEFLRQNEKQKKARRLYYQSLNARAYKGGKDYD